MSLTNLFLTNRRNSVSDDQGRWRQFILDHLDYIAARSRTFDIQPEMMNLYRYDLARFLKDELNRHEDLGWIVQLLNGMDNDFAFVDVSLLIVPDDALILKLYTSYKTIQTNANK